MTAARGATEREALEAAPNPNPNPLTLTLTLSLTLTLTLTSNQRPHGQAPTLAEVSRPPGLSLAVAVGGERLHDLRVE